MSWGKLVLLAKLRECAAKRIHARGSHPWAIIHGPTGSRIQGLPEMFNYGLGPRLIGGAIFFTRKRDAEAALQALIVAVEAAPDMQARLAYFEAASVVARAHPAFVAASTQEQIDILECLRERSPLFEREGFTPEQAAGAALFEMVPKPWCERCQSYHHESAQHIDGRLS
jgi:hypothetical protein